MSSQNGRRPWRGQKLIKEFSGFSKAAEIASKFKRFKVALTEQEEMDQLLKKAKLIPLINFAQFAPVSEEAFEDWVDSVAPIVNRMRICLPLFYEMWITATTPSYTAAIQDIVTSKNGEELVNAVSDKM